MPDPTDAPPFDDLWEALGCAERRRILATLSRRPADTTVAVDDLIESVESPSAGVSLRHAHLPKLVALDLVDWDRDRRRVSRGPRFGVVEPLLDLLGEYRTELPERAAATPLGGDSTSD
jgi:hypothetical protein